MKITLTDIPNNFFKDSVEEVESIEIEIPNNNIVSLNSELNYPLSFNSSRELVFRFGMLNDEYNCIIKNKEN